MQEKDGAQWLTVRQFADIAGVSTEAVRQRLHKDLASYVRTENKRKFVNADALQFIGKTRGSQELGKQLASPAEAVALDVLTAELDRVRGEVERLRGMLDAEVENRHRAEQAAAVTAAERDAERRRADGLEKQLSTLSDALQREQAIHAGAVRKLLDGAKPETEVNAAEAVTVDAVQSDAPTKSRAADHRAPDRQRKPEVQKRKSGLFSSLFGKKSRK